MMESRYGSTEQMNFCLNEGPLERLFLQQWAKLVRCLRRMVRTSGTQSWCRAGSNFKGFR